MKRAYKDKSSKRTCLENVGEERAGRREEEGLGLRVGLLTVDLRIENVGFERDLKRDAILRRQSKSENVRVLKGF